LNVSTFLASTNDENPEFDHHASEAHNLFQASGLYLHRNYADFLVVTEDGNPESRVIAAAALSIRDDEVEFSVAVDARYKRQGLAKRLVEKVERHAQCLAGEFDWENPIVEANVVNPDAMVPLLTSMGYSPPAVTGGYWTKNLV
jgi:GNAT superfamily N-acetyltransferase